MESAPDAYGFPYFGSAEISSQFSPPELCALQSDSPAPVYHNLEPMKQFQMNQNPQQFGQSVGDQPQFDQHQIKFLQSIVNKNLNTCRIPSGGNPSSSGGNQIEAFNLNKSMEHDLAAQFIEKSKYSQNIQSASYQNPPIPTRKGIPRNSIGNSLYGEHSSVLTVEKMRECVTNNKLDVERIGRLCFSSMATNMENFNVVLKDFVESMGLSVTDFTFGFTICRPDCNAYYNIGFAILKKLEMNRSNITIETIKNAESSPFSLTGSLGNIKVPFGVPSSLAEPFRAGHVVGTDSLVTVSIKCKSATHCSSITYQLLKKTCSPLSGLQHYTWVTRNLSNLLKDSGNKMLRDAEELSGSQLNGVELVEEEVVVEEEEEDDEVSPKSKKRKIPTTDCQNMKSPQLPPRKYKLLPDSLVANLINFNLQYFDIADEIFTSEESFKLSSLQCNPKFLTLGNDDSERLMELCRRRSQYRVFMTDVFPDVLKKRMKAIRDCTVDEDRGIWIERPRPGQKRKAGNAGKSKPNNSAA